MVKPRTRGRSIASVLKSELSVELIAAMVVGLILVTTAAVPSASPVEAEVSERYL